MSEKLIVKNFAGIKDLELDVKRINILIGPQASGKSVCAKLLYYFKNFIWQILPTVVNDLTKRELDVNYVNVFKEYFPPESWGNGEFYIRYEVSNVFIDISRKADSKTKIAIHYSPVFHQELKKLRDYAKQAHEEIIGAQNRDKIFLSTDLLQERLFESLNKAIDKTVCFRQLFIPAGRSFFSGLQNNIFTLISHNYELDPFLIEFGSIYESAKNFYEYFKKIDSEMDQKKILNEINKLSEILLYGKHLKIKGKDFLKLDDTRLVHLIHSSSGQQEVFPLVVMLATLPFRELSSSGLTLYIEEPEAHLFPNAQRNIVELISIVFNLRKKHLQFFITTHSPYVLTAFNNLLQAGLLYENANEETAQNLKKIVPKFKSLNVSDFAAYALADGKATNIICPETGLIDAKVIDSVSDDLAIEFDRLLDLA